MNTTEKNLKNAEPIGDPLPRLIFRKVMEMSPEQRREYFARAFSGKSVKGLL